MNNGNGTTTSILQLHNARKVYASGIFRKSNFTVAADNVNISIDPLHGITTIAGESGSGKTTVANLLLGVITPTSGEVRYQGKNLRSMNRAEKREFRREVQAIFQDPFEVYNPFYKVDHVLKTPLNNFGIVSNKDEMHEKIITVLEMVGLRPKDTLGRFPHQLSGGQRQRIMVARSLLLEPRAIIADEPVSMVDASLRATILESINRFNKELGIAIIYITHDLTTAFQISENIIIMYKGKVVESGAVQQVIGKPQHPYTQLLVESIPQPNPKKRWAGTVVQHETGSADTLEGCQFAPRCPYVKEECHVKQPPLYITSQNKAVSCYLYKDESHGTADSSSDVFVSTAEDKNTISNSS